MSVFAEFHIPTEVLALEQTFENAPETVIEVERVVAATDILTPYFWVSTSDLDRFEEAAKADTSVENLEQVDTFEDAALYRANWTENVESIVYAYTNIGALILEATGSADVWELQMRFDDHDRLRQFQEYCVEHGLPYDLQRLHDISNPKTSSQYDLTDKQHTALMTAWEAGYFETPREATLEDLASDLEISQQALSNRVRRGLNTLISNTLRVRSPEDEN